MSKGPGANRCKPSLLAAAMLAAGMTFAAWPAGAAVPPTPCGSIAAKWAVSGDANSNVEWITKRWVKFPAPDNSSAQHTYLTTLLDTLAVGCKFPTDSNVAALVAQKSTAFAKYYLMEEEDWRDIHSLLSLSDVSGSFNQAGERQSAMLKLRLSQMPPLAAWNHLNWAYLHKLTVSGGETMALAWFLDEEQPVRELVRLKFLQQCRADAHQSVFRWALCTVDAKAMDRNKLHAELRDASVTPLQRVKILMDFAETYSRVAATERELQTKGNADPAFKKWFLDIPQQAAATWDAYYKKHQSLIDLVYHLDDVVPLRSRKAMEGCGPQLLSALGQLVKEKKPKSWDDIDELFASPIGYLIAGGLGTCYKFDSDRAEAEVFPSLIARRPAHLGMRVAIYQALLGAAPTLKFDNGSKIKEQDLPRFKLDYGRETSRNTASGVVASIESPPGDEALLKVTFKKVSYKAPVCVQTKDTSQIDRIDETGHFLYRQVCVRKETQTFDGTDDPIVVPKAMAAGIKPGYFLRALLGHARSAVPVFLTKGPADEKPIEVFGATLSN